MSRPPEPRILLTGGTGFLGRHVGRELFRLGTPFTVLARSARRATWYHERGCNVSLGDLTDLPACQRAVRGCRSVLHLAGAADVSNPAINARVNVEGLETLLTAARQEGVENFVFVSSTCAGREKRDAYGETKLSGEAKVRAAGLPFTIVRPTMIYGKGSKEFDTFVRAIRFSPVVPIIGSGTNVIQPVFVDDAVAVLTRLALDQTTARGSTYDLAGPAPISFDELVQQVARALGRGRRRIVHLPPAPLLLIARALGRLATHVPLTVDQVLAFLQDTRVDLGSLQRDLGFMPRPLAEGLPLALSAARETAGSA